MTSSHTPRTSLRHTLIATLDLLYQADFSHPPARPVPPDLRDALAAADAVLQRTGSVDSWHEQAVLGALGALRPGKVLKPYQVYAGAPVVPIMRHPIDALPIPVAERSTGHWRRIDLGLRVFARVMPARERWYADRWTHNMLALHAAIVQPMRRGGVFSDWEDEDYTPPGLVLLTGQQLYQCIRWDSDLFLYPLPTTMFSDSDLGAFRTTANVGECVEYDQPNHRYHFWRWWLDAAVPAAYQAIPDLDRVPTTGRMVSLADLPLEDVLILPEPAPPPPPDPALRFPADLPYDLRRAMAAADTVLSTVGDVPTWHAQGVLGALGAPSARLVPQTAHVPYHNLTIAYRACPPSAFIPLAERTPGHRRRIDLAWRVFQYMQGDRVLSGAVLRDRELLQRATAGELPVGQRTFARAARHDPPAQILKIVGQALQDAIERDGDLFLYPLPEFFANVVLSPWITTVSWPLELRPPLGDPAQVAFWRWWLDEAVPAAYRAIPDMGHERATALTI